MSRLKLERRRSGQKEKKEEEAEEKKEDEVEKEVNDKGRVQYVLCRSSAKLTCR